MQQPRRFTIDVAPSFAPHKRIHWQRNCLCIDVGDQEQQVQKPRICQWEEFWRLCDFIDLWNWAPDYGVAAARDGTRWQIDIGGKSKHIVSRGHSCYPSLEDAKLGTSRINRVSLLLHFVELTLLNVSPYALTAFSHCSRKPWANFCIPMPCIRRTPWRVVDVGPAPAKDDSE